MGRPSRGGMIGLSDYILFLLSLKKRGKLVDLGHIVEKCGRDMGENDQSVIEATLSSLVERGDVAVEGDMYKATDRGRERFSLIFEERREEFTSLNEAWSMVYVAKNYYPHVADVIADLCRGRYVGFFCVFTDKHFFRRKLGKDYITINSPSDLLRLVDIHYIDVIPCVHRVGEQRPDWLVVDLDAGDLVSFSDVKRAAILTYRALEAHEMRPALKFSGGRGFQVWAAVNDFELPSEYRGYPHARKTKGSGYFFLFADMVAYLESSIRSEMEGKTTSVVSDKSKRRDKILLDPSSMKEMGLVRSPYSIHHRTGLVSMPLEPDEVEEFEPSMATPERVLERFKRRGNDFKLEPRDPTDLVEATLRWKRSI